MMPKVTKIGVWGWLAAMATVLLIWWPLRFSLEAGMQVGTRLALVTVQPEWSSLLRDGIVNVLIFVPFGIVARVTSGATSRRIALVALGLGGLLELGQVFQVARIVSLPDVLANGVGGVLGAALPGGMRATLLRAGRTRLRPEVLALVATVLAIGAAAWLQARFADLTPWLKVATLQIGDEATGDRPWCGEVRALAWQVGGRRWTEDDFVLERRHRAGRAGSSCGASSWRQTPLPPSELVAAVEDVGRLRLDLVAIPASAAQFGPARIVSLSTDIRHRNLTVAQEGDDLVLRVRRRWGGENGMRPYFRLPDVFAVRQPVAIGVELSSDSTVITAGERALRYRHDVTGQWWTLLIPSLEARDTPLEVVARVVFWLVMLGPLGAHLGALRAAGRVTSTRTVTILLSIALATVLASEGLHGPSPWEALLAIPVAIGSSAMFGMVVSRPHGRPRERTSVGDLPDPGSDPVEPLRHHEARPFLESPAMLPITEGTEARRPDTRAVLRHDFDAS